MGEISEVPEGLDASALSPEEDETLDIIQEEIINSPITPENVISFAKMYTLYSKKQIDQLVKKQPQLIVMKAFSKELERFLEEADKGDYTNVARFLRSEREKMVSGLHDPKNERWNNLGNKLGEIAQVLSPQPQVQRPPIK